MLFNSFHYFAFFLFVLLVVDAVRKRNYQHTFLLFASYYFYWAFSSIYVLLLIFPRCFISIAAGRHTSQQLDERKGSS